MRSAAVLGVLVGSIVWLGASSASAEAGAAAQQLFEKGVQDMLAGRYEAGCPAIAESYRLTPLPGALFTLAECESRWGKLASAAVHYRQYLALVATLPPEQRAKQAERMAIAKDQADALDAAVPTLTLKLPRGAPPDVSVSLDGTELAATALGTAMPVDAGEHTVVVALPDGQRREQTVTVANGDRRALTLLLPEATSGASAAEPGTPDVGATGPSSGGDGQQTAGYVVGAAGVVGLLVGAATGIAAIVEKGTAMDNCEDVVCNAEGLDAANSSKTLGDVSTVGFVVGAAALAAGVVLLLTAPSGEEQVARRSPRLVLGVGPGGPGGAMLDLRW